MTGRGEAKDDLSRKLDVLILLAAAQIGADLPVSERVPLLHRFGLTRDQIATVCGTSALTVSVRLSEHRRRKRERRTKT